MQKIRLYCPDCGEENFGLRLAEKRFNQQYCYECNWEGAVFEPDIKAILTTRKYHDYISGFRYEIYDKYGQCSVSSRAYSTELECETELIKELEHRNRDLYGTPYTGILWPDYIEVTGKVYK